jgi:hypothetical protein
MATLTDDVKAFVVQALACFDTPTQVANAVKEEFGITIERMQVAAYDPTKFAGRKLSAKWRALFEATRTAFLEDQAAIPIANQNFRLRALDRLYQQAASRGNAPLAAQLIEQAAKETGGAFTNRHKLEHTGKGGGPMQAISTVTNDPVEAAKIYASIMNP